MNLSNDIHPWDIGDDVQQEQALSFEDVAPILKACSGKVQFADPVATCDDIVPGKRDILCGRDKQAFNHVGNKRFRAIVNMNRERYQKAKNRDEKTRITDEIIASIIEGQSRFLKYDPISRLWRDVSKEYAHEKVSHALRSAKDPKKRCSRKKRVTFRRKIYTEEEDEVFNFLLSEQKKIFKELLEEELGAPEDAPIDFSIIDEIGSSAIAV